MTAVWKNWAGNQVANGLALHKPTSESEIVAIVDYARAAKQHVKVVGHGHSFTDIAVTDGHIVSLDNYNRVLKVSRDALEVTVESGIQLLELNDRLDALGYAMPNLGDIAYQSVAGATSTSTHGTGGRMKGLAAQIVALTMVTADGRIIECSPTKNPDIFHVARVGLGALGIISTVTLKVVQSFNLHAIEEPMRLDHVLENIDKYVADNDFFEFFWVPHTGWALTKRNNATDRQPDPSRRVKTWWNKTVMENYAFGLVCALGRVVPRLIPKLAKALPSSGRTEYVNKSYKIFASKRIVKFYEMEYAIPRHHLTTALKRVVEMVDAKGFLLNFPVEVRFTAADDIPLSTSSGRDSAYIAVHIYKGMSYRPYFEAVEAIMNDYEGRPHWGKLHFQSLETLSARYPEYKRFADVRNRLDPEGVFTNDYLRRVLGN